MHIVRLEAENVKRLHAVNIKPDGNLVQITGPNGAGKSAVLGAIIYGLGGKRMEPPEPIRRGAKSMRIVLDLGDLIIKRVRGADGSKGLTIERPDGSRVPTPHGPQTLLDELYDERTFDPQAFNRMSAKDQAVTLKSVVGLNFDDFDGKRLGLFEQRTEARRNLKTLAAQRDAIPKAEAPDEEISAVDLSEQLAKALGILSRNDQYRLDAERALQEHESAECDLREAERNLGLAKQALADAAENVRSSGKALDTIVDPDVEGIKQQIAGAEQVNRRVREKKQRTALSDDVTAVKTTDESLSAQIDQIDAEKARLLASASMPIDGLSVGADGLSVTLNGFPLKQAASSEQMIVSAAIGHALKPELDIALFEDGSLLDADNLARFGEWADKKGVQVWIECVGDDKSVGVYIEDGYASGAEALPVETA